MTNSIILPVVIGLIIIIFLFIILLLVNRKRSYNKIKSIEMTKKHNQKNDINFKMEIETIFKRIQSLEQEVLQLKQENNILIEEFKNNILSKENNLKNNNFKPILNYNLFKERNNIIIDLYKAGKTKEEIAKVLNKSIREIEMVIKLIE